MPVPSAPFPLAHSSAGQTMSIASDDYYRTSLYHDKSDTRSAPPYSAPGPSHQRIEFVACPQPNVEPIETVDFTECVNPNGSFYCPVCSKTFVQKYKLKRHYLIHTGDKPFSCPLCDFKCNQKNNLKVHMICKH